MNLEREYGIVVFRSVAIVERHCPFKHIFYDKFNFFGLFSCWMVRLLKSTSVDGKNGYSWFNNRENDDAYYMFRSYNNCYYSSSEPVTNEEGEL